MHRTFCATHSLLFATLFVGSGSANTAHAPDYAFTGHGVDVSFPMHWYPPPGSDAATRYAKFIDGCAQKFTRTSCVNTEETRMEMNREQARRQRNYTELGFAKIPAPAAAYEPARAFWEAHRHEATIEQWPPGNTYVNNWVSPTHMVSLEDRRFQPQGLLTKQAIWDGLKPVLEAWTGQKLKPTSLYGIRVYGEDSILATHLDRLPLVSSAIMQIDQDVDEPWPIEVVGHDGRAYNVTLEPGEIALYESHTVLHGRPYELRGNFFANVFVHFIPVDSVTGANEAGVDFNWQKESRDERRSGRYMPHAFPKPPPHKVSMAAAAAASAASVAKPLDYAQRSGGPSPPPALRKEAGHQIANGEDFGEDSFATGTATNAHFAAANGDLDALLKDLTYHPANLNAGDENLWTPLHEAARAQDALDVVKALVEHGADLGARTITGATALYLARRYKNTAIANYLESIGAPEIADEL